ncbi:unnamed protein product [Parnassius apollo]|uniref:(apollo) hypothetical protein n=1 Tax=Parnassius apollo TaxID=110799 RepID=A0A8S3XC46_PARAO|nr:unnamed protein product [Parnassius apollo]
MFRHVSVEDLAIIALLLEEEDRDKTKKRAKRMAVHPTLKKRKLEGEYWTLFKELIDDEEKFFLYFRMSRFQFDILLKKIELLITKQDTVFKEALSPKEKLAVCLR